MSIAYSQLHVALKIVKSSPHNMKFIQGNCHVSMGMETLFFLKKKIRKLSKLKAANNNEDSLTQI